MITKLGQVNIYVPDQAKALAFWQEKMGFRLVKEETFHGMRWYELAADEQNETSIVIHDKAKVAEMSPDVHLGTPSLMFVTKDIEAFRSDLQAKGVFVGDVMEFPTGKVCNFADDQENYFAVMEVR
ncbi:VOC family protein [Mangrovibacillus cuniculi]|uniref:VOC family protein n=1 Tax=Mangrovibacillus cuniculi TaxID=2593652 RepID=A0A7S8C8W0_9BACI|nr:VOC family protein [Mangrovibacillus cuniculi]QPC45565.1 VOC family protein [Mangrovibacillus cuniculi]